MEIYERLAPIYDGFFPQNRQATSFLLGLTNGGQGAERSTERGDRPLAVDFGCATGSQALDLVEAGWRAVGCDPCAPMLEVARRKAGARGLSASFEAREMLEAAVLFRPASVDLALCLGNTLPYLRGGEELGRFASALSALLAAGGYAVLQLLNYERILALLAEGEYRFPPLSAGGAVFERSYAMAPDGKPVFRVELADGNGRLVETSRLTPFTREEIAGRLAAAGFERIMSCSGWDGAAFDPARDMYLIMVAKRTA